MTTRPQTTDHATYLLLCGLQYGIQKDVYVRLKGIAVVLALLAGACVPSPTIRPLDRIFSDTTTRTGKAVVLFRVTARIGTDTVRRPPYRLELVDLATRASEPVRVFSPSRELRDDGWGYFLVAPGQYRLIAIYLFSGYPSRDFQLTVDAEGSIVYVGSLSINCERESMLLFTLITDCSNMVVNTETPPDELADEHALPLSTRLLRPFREPQASRLLR